MGLRLKMVYAKFIFITHFNKTDNKMISYILLPYQHLKSMKVCEFYYSFKPKSKHSFMILQLIFVVGFNFDNKYTMNEEILLTS